MTDNKVLVERDGWMIFNLIGSIVLFFLSLNFDSNIRESQSSPVTKLRTNQTMKHPAGVILV